MIRELKQVCFKCKHYINNYNFNVICEIPKNSDTGYECPDKNIPECPICLKCKDYNFCKMMEGVDIT